MNFTVFNFTAARQPATDGVTYGGCRAAAAAARE